MAILIFFLAVSSSPSLRMTDPPSLYPEEFLKKIHQKTPQNTSIHRTQACFQNQKFSLTFTMQ